MPLPASLPAPVLETILTSLAALFIVGAGGDVTAARQAASHLLAAYNPADEDEVRLAANIIGFSFHALAALGQSIGPDTPITRVLRLRGSAVTMHRESMKAERGLAQLRKAREHGLAAPVATIQPAAAAPPQPATEPVPAATPAAIPAQGRELGKVTQLAMDTGVTGTKAYEERQREARIAASVAKAEARFGTPASAMQPERPSAQTS